MFNWLSYFWSGALAIIVSFVLSGALMGCKFGNYVEKQENPDKWSAYYDMSPQVVKLCASTPNESCIDVGGNNVPDEIGVVMTDPVIFIVNDLNTGEAYFVPKTKERLQLPVYLDMNDGKSLSYIGSLNPTIFWDDEKCTSKLYIEENGSLEKSRISVDISVIRSFNGDCAESLRKARDCYNDITQCGGANATENRKQHDWVTSLFGPYIDQGRMTADGIATATSIAYQVSYR